MSTTPPPPLLPPFVEELADRVRNSPERQERVYLAKGYATGPAAESAVAAHAPLIIGTREARFLHWREIDVTTGSWEVDVTWEAEEADGTDPTEFPAPIETFSTRGGTTHITQDRGNRDVFHDSTYLASKPDNGGAINVVDGVVEGADIVTPVYQFGYQVSVTPAEWQALKGILFRCTGKVNAGAFDGFDGGEVLCLGGSGRRQNGRIAEVSVEYAASKNLTNIPVGGITVPAKFGWELLSVMYGPRKDAKAGEHTRVPHYAVVHEVYEATSFAGLPTA